MTTKSLKLKRATVLTMHSKLLKSRPKSHIENDRTTKQEENILELKKRMEKLEKKLEEFREALEAEKDKTKALDIKLRDAQKVVIDLTPRCQEYEDKTFCSNKFKDHGGHARAKKYRPPTFTFFLAVESKDWVPGSESYFLPNLPTS